MGLLPGTRFEHDGAVLTPLGPRDDAWLERAVTAPKAAIDILPWWFDITDARYQLARALVILWTEIRWRAPIDDVELRAMDEALALLRNAIRADGSLAYPWREWAELVAHRGSHDPAGPCVPVGRRGRPGQPLIATGAGRSRSSTRLAAAGARDVQRAAHRTANGAVASAAGR